MTVRRLAVLTSVFSLLSTAAWAQSSAPARPAPEASSGDAWTGLYAGANVGHVSNTFTSQYDFASVVAGGTTFPAETLAFPAAGAGSGTIGFQVGYGTHLTRALVGGLEVQLTKTSATLVNQAATLTAAQQFFTSNDTLTIASGKMFSIRGRAGTTFMPQLFVYGTIGVAMTSVTATGEFPAIGSFPEANGSDSHTMKGLTVGVGAEYAPWKRGSLENLTIGAEFRHASLGTQAFNVANVQVTLPPVSEFAIGTVTASANEFDVRVNYRFSLKKLR